MHSIKINLEYPSGTRREVFQGVEHLVVPVVMIVDGVLNDALLTQEEYGKHVESWNGVPVPVLHPEENGVPVSANRPDIIEKNTIGQIFYATAEGGKLKAEAWLNTEKANRLGYGHVLTALASGEIMEVSTGYFADADVVAGEYNGVPYNEIHRNLRPDHLALLPGEIGACSVADGCGTRVNNQRSVFMKVNDAMKTIAQALGLRSNCECKGGQMDLITKATELKANGSISAKQLQMLQEMDDDTRKLMAALIDAMGTVAAVAEEEEEEPQSMDNAIGAAPVATQNQKGTVPVAEVQKMVANALRRQRVIDALTANSACAFDEADLQVMSIEQLEKYEKSIRPVDYSGAGGFATNSNAADTNIVPMLPRGALAAKKGA
jgi:hypothetical protein